MKPILFPENSTTFGTNGIGRLSDAISCTVTEQRNGEYEMEMEYLVSGKHYSDLRIRRIIFAQPSYGTARQAFRIYKISKPISGRVVVSARHISYDLSKNVAMPFSVEASPSACATTLARLKGNAVEACPFAFWTDVTTAAGYSQAAPASIRQRLGGVEGSVLDQFGGEYEFDNFSVKLHRKRGSDRGVTLRYGKNITDLAQEENIANTITGVVPYWTNMDGTESVVLPEKAVYSPNAPRYSHKLTVPLDLSDKWDEPPAVAALRAAAQAYVNGSDIGIPKVSVKVSFVNLRDTEEYGEVASMEGVNLCDDIRVQFEPLGIDTTAEVVETVWDVLMERYDSVTVGALKSSLAATINDQNMHTMAEIDKSRVSAYNAINNATKWLTSAGGYVIAIKNEDGSWKELVFASSTDLEARTTKCLRINNNGLGFSTTGINGPYTNAWTIDGNLVADFIHGGTLTLGGNGNGNGWLKIVNASGAQIGKWDKDGIGIAAGSIRLGTPKDGAYPFQVTADGRLSATGATISGTVTATSGTLSSVTVTSLKLGDTTWTGDELDQRLAYILSVANKAQDAADKAQDAADDANEAIEDTGYAFKVIENINDHIYNWFQEIWDDGVGKRHDRVQPPGR